MENEQELKRSKEARLLEWLLSEDWVIADSHTHVAVDIDDIQRSFVVHFPDAPVLEVERLVEYADRHREYWQGKDDSFWLKRLVEEVEELDGVLAGIHDDTVEHELRQIGSICINWLRKRRTAAKTGGQE